MIPSGGNAAAEKNSFPAKEEILASDEGYCRDSLADIIESLDVDLEDYETNSDNDSDRNNSDPSMMDEARDSFDEQVATEDLNELNMDFELDVDDSDPDDNDDLVDHSIDDDDHDVEAVNRAFLASSEPDEPAVSSHLMPRTRLSSADMISSVDSISSGRSEHGNLCTLIWEDGLLGLRLRMSQSRMLPVVSKITGQSSIFGIHLIDVGDLLIQIGSKATQDMEFIEAVNYLKEVEKPCKLVFRRINSDPMAVKPVQPRVTSSIATKLAQKFDELMKAENEKALPLPSVKFEARYEVKWNDGPLGISLVASKDVPFPLVTRITGKNRSSQVQDVQSGHYLVQIGNYNTAEGNFNAAIKYLQRVTKPVSLFFCPGNKKTSIYPELRDDEYDHVWEKKQPLCFTVKSDASGRIIVADLGNAKSMKLKAKGLNATSNVVSGDYIEWINDENTKGMSFHEALMKLRTAKRPLVVRFKKAPQIPMPLIPLSHSTSAAVIQQEPPTPAAASESVKEPVKGRSFNPLKKIAAYAKENNINVPNIRTNDKKSKDPVSELPVAAPITTKPLHSSKSLPQNSTSHVQTQAPVTLLPNGINLKTVSSNAQPQKSSSLLKTSSDPAINEQKPASAPVTTTMPITTSGASPQELYNIHNSRGASDTSEEYEVVWPEGTALGLTLRVHPFTRFPVVARVTGISNLKNIEHVTPGDILFAANNMPIMPQPKFKQTLENLSKLPKPAVLRFRRASPLEQMQQMQIQQPVVHRSHPPVAPVAPAATTAPKAAEHLPLAQVPPLQENEYELIWRENANLGLVFSSENEIPKVAKVDIESGGPSLNKVSSGDTLIFIGSISLNTMNFHTSMATLRAVKRPVVLRFQMRRYGAVDAAK
jgi:hypothetical protein